MKLPLAALLCAIFACAHAVVINRVHLAVTGSPDSMRVSWMTDVATEQSVVTYGLSSGHYTVKTLGNSSTYNVSAGYFHNAKLTNLAPLTKYYYVCASESSVSAEFSFVTGPPVNSNAPLSVGVVGDLGISKAGNMTFAALSNLGPKNAFNFVVHTGDLAYAGDNAPSLFEPAWNAYFDLLQGMTGYIPYMVSPGNNDRGCKFEEPCRGELPATHNFSAYNYRFDMPFRESEAPRQSLFYSWDYGMTHFIAISSETDFLHAPWGEAGPNGTQIPWLKADLIKANANRKNVPWIVVFGHRPIYSSCLTFNDYFNPIGDAALMQSTFEDLFYEYKVDIYLNGHVHGYERSWPVYRSRHEPSYVNPTSPVHIMCGAGGNIEGMDPGMLWGPKPSWTAERVITESATDRFDFTNVGYGVLTFHNHTHLTWEFRRSETNVAVDSITIVQDSHQ